MEGAKALKLAEKIARRAHRRQKRQDGIEPYIRHPERVAKNCQLTESKIVAWLHDVVEDTELTLEDLRKAGFSKQIVDAVDAITHRDYESYISYILRVRANELACWVKMADILDNMTDNIGKSRREKYQLALYILGWG